MTLLRVLILWVPEQHNWGTDGLQMNVWGQQSHAYIIKHPISTQLTSCNGIHWHEDSDILLVLILWVQSSTTGDGWSPMNCVGTQFMAYISSTQSQHNWLLWWNTLTSGTVTLLLVLILWGQSSTTGGSDCIKWIVWGRAVSCLHNQHPIETQLTPCDGIPNRYKWHLLRVLILWVPEQHNWRTDGLKWIVLGGEQSHA